MAKQSAGILLYKIVGRDLQVFLVHPGGPFWVKKDQGAWSIPKGEYTEDEEPLAAAKREFQEEVGRPAPVGEYIELGEFKRKDGKVIRAWGVEGDFDATDTVSNTFEMEWPPKSGQTRTFSEIDKADWFPLELAVGKMHSGQPIFLERLAEKLQLPQVARTEQQRLL